MKKLMPLAVLGMVLAFAGSAVAAVDDGVPLVPNNLNPDDSTDNCESCTVQAPVEVSCETDACGKTEEAPSVAFRRNIIPVQTVLNFSAARVYTGFLVDAAGNIAGSIDVTFAKTNSRMMKTTFKATLMYGTKKDTATGWLDGKGVATVSSSPSTMTMTLDENTIAGTYGRYTFAGVLNIFRTKPSSLAESRTVRMLLEQWRRNVYTLVWKEGTSWIGGSAQVSSKGYLKVAGWRSVVKDDKTKVNTKSFSLKGYLVHVNDRSLVTLVSTREDFARAMNLWRKGSEYTLEGVADGKVGVVGPLAKKSGAKIDNSLYQAECDEQLAQGKITTVPTIKMDDNGKWVCEPADAAKKLGMGFSFNSKSGRFQGKFRQVYTNNKKTAKMFGHVVNGVGYGFVAGYVSAPTPVTIGE